MTSDTRNGSGEAMVDGSRIRSTSAWLPQSLHARIAFRKPPHYCVVNNVRNVSRSARSTSRSESRSATPNSSCVQPTGGVVILGTLSQPNGADVDKSPASRSTALASNEFCASRVLDDSRCLVGIGCWQTNDEARSIPRRAFHYDRTARVLHDAEDRGKPQSSVPVRCFCRKERFENALPRFSIHAATGVPNGENNVKRRPGDRVLVARSAGGSQVCSYLKATIENPLEYLDRLCDDGVEIENGLSRVRPVLRLRNAQPARRDANDRPITESQRGSSLRDKERWLDRGISFWLVPPHHINVAECKLRGVVPFPHTVD